MGNIANVAATLAEGQRRLGHEARVIAFATGSPRPEADEVLGGSGPIGWNLAMHRLPVRWDGLDAVHIHGGIWLSQLYYRLLRVKAKSAAWVVHLHGSETRYGKGLHHLGLADAVLASTPDLVRWVPTAVWLPNPVHIPDAVPEAPRSDRVVFGHFPSNRRMKGTGAILDAFREAFGDPEVHGPAQRGGTRWRWDSAELIIGEGLPQSRVFEWMEETHAVVDQLTDTGSFGLVALEAFARGRAALSSYDPGLFPPDCPVLRIGTADVADVLGACVEDPDRLADGGRAGRRYVERFHGLEAAARRTVEIYERAGRARRSR